MFRNQVVFAVLRSKKKKKIKHAHVLYDIKKRQIIQSHNELVNQNI